MKKTLKSKLTIVLLALLSLFVFAGCSVRQSVNEFLDENKLVAQVTYYANDGKFENNADVKTIYYHAGDKVLNVGVTNLTSGSISITKNNYEFIGWYYVELGEDGLPIRDENGEIILGDEVDFSVGIKEGEQWHICAKWRKMAVVEVVLLCDEDVTITVGEGDAQKSYQNGDVIHSYNFTEQGEMQSTSNAPVNANDGTFVEFTANAEATEEVSWPIRRPEDGSNVTIYAKYIAGVWTLLRTADDVKDLFSSDSAMKNAYYLMNDIDCAGLTRAPINIFNSHLQGNGYTISNLTFEKVGTSALGAGAKASMFGTLKKDAVIENVVFDNITMNYEVRSNAMAEIYLVYTAMEEGAKANGVTINATMNITLGSNAFLANDIQTNWKYGGVESDNAYETVNPNAFITSGSKIAE